MTAAESRPIAHELPFEERPKHRRLFFEGAHNFRDMGGYQTDEGKQVKWGHLYRSDRLSNLTDEDLKFLNRLQLKHIIDFRSDNERNAAPSRLPKESQIETVKLPVFEDGAFVDALWQAIASGQLLGRDLHDIMVEANRNFVRQHNKPFAQFLKIVAQSQNTPLMFHCMAGKDRTGFGAALILTILGVSEEDVLSDYLQTNIHLEANSQLKYEELTTRINSQASYEELKPILGVHEDYLAAAFETIQADYKSFDDYLYRGLGLNERMVENMRRAFLD
ncbi:MAG: tyrosine-protein phosphatase [Parvibaculales bacterium]